MCRVMGLFMVLPFRSRTRGTMFALAPLRDKLTLFRHSGSVKMTDKVDDRAFCPTRLQRLLAGYFQPSISNGSLACLVVHSTASGETALRRLQQGLLCPMPHSATAPSLALVLEDRKSVV